MKKVTMINGVPALEIDGEYIVPAAYMTYLNERADYARFSRMGFGLYSVGMRLSEFAGNEETGLTGGFTPQTWTGENEYDFSSLDGDIEQLLRETGDRNAKIILRINLNMPGWWRKKFPEELTLFDNGQRLMQSISSKRWREDAAVYLSVLKKHLEERGYDRNVIAWQPAAMHTEEWFAPFDVTAAEDFSLPAQNAFQSFCRKKYGSVQTLNEAWNTSFSSFAEVAIPDANTRKIKCGHAFDYFTYKNEAYADTAEWFCRYIKDLFDRDIFVGCFGGYIGQLPKNYGHCAFSKLLHSENIDFFASPFAYTELRGKSVDWMYHSAIETTRLAGKLWFIEADVRTDRTRLLTECAPWLFDHKISYYEENPVWLGPDKQNSLWNLLRSFSKMFISRNAFWWFDMWGGWYADEAYEKLLQRTYELYVKEAFSAISSASEVAVVLDETASMYVQDDTFYKAVYEQLISLGYLGAPYELLLLQDLKITDLSRYKTVLFLAPAPTDKNRNLMESLCRIGKTVLTTGDENGAFGGVTGAYAEEELLKKVSESGTHIFSAGNIVYANGKYISVTARKDGKVLLTMPYDCVLQDCINGERRSTKDKQIILNAKANQTYLFEIKQEDIEEKIL